MSETGKTEFDVLAEDYDFWQRHTIGPPNYDRFLNYLPQSANRVLDAGCGSSILALRLAGLANYVVGVDISRSMIALAKKRQAEQQRNNVNFVIADLETLPFKDETFDFVVSRNTLSLTRLDVTLPGLRRLVKPGGRMILSDVVKSAPAWMHRPSPIWLVLRAFKNAPGYARAHGLRTMWRVVSFLISPAWIRHLQRNKKLTPEAFQNIYGRFLPGCEFKSSGWYMTAFWVAPEIGN